MRSILTALILIALFIPTAASAAELNAGFVHGLWYSEKQLIAGETVRIYVALRNNTEHDLTGTVRFEDDEKRIGTTDIRALPGRLVEAWIDWKPTYGEHTLKATLTDVELHPVGGKTESGEPASTLAEDIVFVDYDTDKDGIPNETDGDDDGDGVNDEDELEAGTDPLVFNEPETEEPENNEDANTEEDASDTSSEPAENTIVSSGDAQDEATDTEGLERYFGDGRVSNSLTNVTDIVHNTKNALDGYRNRRDEQKDEELRQATENALNESEATGEESATITRTRMEEERPNIFVILYKSILGLLDTLYTFVLWLVSKLLAHPALVQLVLLFAILILIYRLARRIGRRPQ
jgi:hypothetical protein